MGNKRSPNKIGGLCENGHLLVIGNYSLRMRKSTAEPHISCLECKSNYSSSRVQNMDPEQLEDFKEKRRKAAREYKQRKREAGLGVPKLTSAERYQKSKQARDDRKRHERIVGSLSKDIVRDFEGALDNYRPQCVLEQNEDGSWPKSPWTDWSSNPDDGEPFERPTRKQARLLCEDCPIAEMCLDWALATGLTHGVVSGRVVENGLLEK